MPEGATDRTTFEGVKTNDRTVLMVEEARYLFKLRGGGTHPRISQGGYSSSVSASAGTHGKDAMDDATKTFGRERALLWEWCNWEVGFAGWRRVYIAGLWPAHFHKLPKSGDLSAAAKDQITQWRQGDNALKSDRDYPRILSSGFVARTWESYLKVRPSGTLELSRVQEAFRSGDHMYVALVQRALNHFLDSKLLVDGVPGPATKGVYKTYQSRLYGFAMNHPTVDGIPGEDSLSKLGFKTVQLVTPPAHI